MGKLTFTVTVEFEDKIVDDNQINQVAKNIAQAIVNEANGYEIAPDDSDTFTKAVEVRADITGETVRKTIM